MAECCNATSKCFIMLINFVMWVSNVTQVTLGGNVVGFVVHVCVAVDTPVLL
jgi:hypothetical protein